MPQSSRYVLVVDNLSSVITASDIRHEFKFAGKIRDVVKDDRHRVALVDFDKAADCTYAWRKMDGFKMDGRVWKVEYANKSDFKFFGWKWTEYTPSPSPPPRSPSRSRSRSRSPASAYQNPNTPLQLDDKQREGSRSV